MLNLTSTLVELNFYSTFVEQEILYKKNLLILKGLTLLYGCKNKQAVNQKINQERDGL